MSDIITLTCNCCEDSFETDAEDRRIGYMAAEDIYWCLPCNTETCGYLGARCSELAEYAAELEGGGE